MDSHEPALARLIDRVAAARAEHATLDIRGGGTKISTASRREANRWT